MVRPAYGHGSLADLLPSVSAVLGVPGAQDVLGLGPQLAGIDRIAVLLVDGLGAHNLPTAAPHAPMLTDLAAGARTLTSGFPSTTPVSLTTLGTGTPPGRHGVLGFTVRRPDGAVLAHLRWDQDPDPRQWQPVPTCFERAAAAGVETFVVSRPEFDGGGLSVASNRGARYVGAPDFDTLATGMLTALAGGSGPALVYGYHPDLDRAGHEHGVDSEPWRAAARDVDRLLDRLVHGLPPRCALLVTADHGQLNIPLEGRLDLSREPDLTAGVVTVAGEPRARYLHTAEGALEDVLAAYRTVLGPSASVLTREEAIADGWYGLVAPAHLGRIGDVVVICHGTRVVLASGWEPPSSATLVAYHGSASDVEMTVPLLVSVVPPG